MLIARKGDTTTLGAKGPVKLKNPPAVRPVNPKNLSLRTFTPQACPKGASKPLTSSHGGLTIRILILFI